MPSGIYVEDIQHRATKMTSNDRMILASVLEEDTTDANEDTIDADEDPIVREKTENSIKMFPNPAKMFSNPSLMINIVGNLPTKHSTRSHNTTGRPK